MFILVAFLILPFILAVFFIGQTVTVVCLLLCTIILANARHPALLLPLILAGLWIAGTFGFLTLVAEPTHTIAATPPMEFGPRLLTVLSDGDLGPVWWIKAMTGAGLAVFLRWPAV